MTARLRQERGWTVVIAIFTITAMLLLGLATYAYVGGQQGQARDERVRMSSFQLAEQAFNSATNFLNVQWPTSGTPYPSTCTQASTGSTCPDTATVVNGDDSTDFAAGQYSWSTEVHDNGTPTASYYKDLSTSTRGQPAYDANGDGSVWVRSQATVRGRTRTIVALVKVQPATVQFPRNAVTAGFFSTGNAGKKVMVDTRSGGQPGGTVGGVVVRCTPSGSPPNSCLNYYPSKNQVLGNVVTSGYTGGNAMSSTDLQKLRDKAQALGTYYTTTCPTNLTGAMIFIEGPANCSYTSNGTYNSPTSPGMLVIVNGTLSMTGTITYYGVIYAANQQNSTGTVVTLGGDAVVQGSIAVDGGGGAQIGSSKKNLIYDYNALSAVVGNAGVNVIQNTWRLL